MMLSAVAIATMLLSRVYLIIFHPMQDFSLKKVTKLNHLNAHPQSPFVLLPGGAKVSSKLGLLKKALLGKLDKHSIGGEWLLRF